MLKLYAYNLRECDPKKCTAGKMARFRLVVEFSDARRIPRGSLLLNPVAEKILSAEDKKFAARGITVIDCSWKKSDSIFLKVKKIRAEHRALPYLLASNPTNFGKPFMLSSAEALAAALYIIGKSERAVLLLSKFKWGDTFWKLNGELLNAYSKAINSEEVLKIQEEYI